MAPATITIHREVMPSGPSDLLAALSRTLPTGFAIVDRQLDATHANEHFMRLTGWPNGQDAVFRGLAERIRELSRLAFQTGDAALDDFIDGSETSPDLRQASLTIQPLRASGGEVESLICLIDDRLSDRHAIEERLNFEQFISNLSTMFVNVSDALLEAQLQQALADL